MVRNTNSGLGTGGGAKGDTGNAGPAGPAGATGATGANGHGVPTGGTTGQVLTKVTDDNYDTDWETPTGEVSNLDAVLTAGSDANGQSITNLANINGSVDAQLGLQSGSGSAGNDGQDLVLDGGFGTTGQLGGNTILSGGAGNGGLAGPSSVAVQGGQLSGNARVGILTDGTNGNDGDVLVSDGNVGSTWQTLITDAAAPPTTFVSLFVFDHTAVTGGLYAWIGSAYVKVSAAP